MSFNKNFLSIVLTISVSFSYLITMLPVSQSHVLYFLLMLGIIPDSTEHFQMPHYQ